MTASNARQRTPTSDATAAQIRAERAASGLSQEAVYTEAGISKSAYLKLESGRNVADISQLAGIVTALGLDLPTFFDRALARMDRVAAPDLEPAPIPDEIDAMLSTSGRKVARQTGRRAPHSTPKGEFEAG